jgi:hypothetical protein
VRSRAGTLDLRKIDNFLPDRQQHGIVFPNVHKLRLAGLVSDARDYDFRVPAARQGGAGDLQCPKGASILLDCFA